jgi:hypothetical protein
MSLGDQRPVGSVQRNRSSTGHPAVLPKLEVAACLEDRSPPRRGLIRRGRTPLPHARSVSLGRTPPLTTSPQNYPPGKPRSLTYEGRVPSTLRSEVQTS